MHLTGKYTQIYRIKIYLLISKKIITFAARFDALSQGKKLNKNDNL